MTSPRSQTTTKSLTNPFHHQTHLKTWVFRGNPRSLQELLESQLGRGEAGKSAQPKLPPVLPKSPPRAPQPPPPSRIEQANPKRRREGNQRAKRRWNLGDLVLPLKKSHTGQLSNRRPARPLTEVQKGAMFRCLSPEHGSQPQCLEVSL